MSLVNFTAREITCKIVYYGPGRSGKTTNLQYVFGRVPETRRGRMVSLATHGDRTLFFDFLPIDLGSISGFSTRFQLYTVPGQSYYNATRKLVLQGADGVVFVADSQARRFDDNLESLQNLQENLLEQGVDIRQMPVVFQYNKQDLPTDLVLAREELDDALNFRGVQSFSADALHRSSASRPSWSAPPIGWRRRRRVRWPKRPAPCTTRCSYTPGPASERPTS
jgi:signal recognition particle receptor subunit beta